MIPVDNFFLQPVEGFEPSHSGLPSPSADQPTGLRDIVSHHPHQFGSEVTRQLYPQIRSALLPCEMSADTGAYPSKSQGPGKASRGCSRHRSEEHTSELQSQFH